MMNSTEKEVRKINSKRDVVELLENYIETIKYLLYTKDNIAQKELKTTHLYTEISRILRNIFSNDILVIDSGFLNKYVSIEEKKPLTWAYGPEQNVRWVTKLNAERTTIFTSEEILRSLETAEGKNLLQNNVKRDLYSFLVQDQHLSRQTRPFKNPIINIDTVGPNKELLALLNEALKDTKIDHFEVSSEKASDYTNGIKTGLELAISIVKKMGKINKWIMKH